MNCFMKSTLLLSFYGIMEIGMIMLKKVNYAANGKCLSVAEKTHIFNSPWGKVQSLLNCIPAKIRNIKGVTSDTFKNHLGEWPDQPRGGGYSVAAESNGIQHQGVVLLTKR